MNEVRRLSKEASPSPNPFPIATEWLVRRPLRRIFGKKKIPFRSFQYFAENAHPLDIVAAEGHVFPAFEDGIIRNWRSSNSTSDRAFLKRMIRLSLSDYGVEANRGNMRLLESLVEPKGVRAARRAIEKMSEYKMEKDAKLGFERRILAWLSPAYRRRILRNASMMYRGRAPSGASRREIANMFMNRARERGMATPWGSPGMANRRLQYRMSGAEPVASARKFTYQMPPERVPYEAGVEYAKAAEAKQQKKGVPMTRYEQGFMNKCAEAGLDVRTTVRLMAKQAGLINGFKRLGSRWWELLKGGNKGVLKDYNAMKDVARRWMDSGIKYRQPKGYDVGRILADELAAARAGQAARKVRVRMNGKPVHVYDPNKVVTDAVRGELDKSLAARVGTGAAALGGIAGLGALAGGGGDYYS